MAEGSEVNITFVPAWSTARLNFCRTSTLQCEAQKDSVMAKSAVTGGFQTLHLRSDKPLALSHNTTDCIGECGFSVLWLPVHYVLCIPWQAWGDDSLFSARILQCCPVPVWLTAQFEGGRKTLCCLWMMCQSQVDQLLLLSIMWECVRVIMWHVYRPL